MNSVNEPPQSYCIGYGKQTPPLEIQIPMGYIWFNSFEIGGSYIMEYSDWSIGDRYRWDVRVLLANKIMKCLKALFVRQYITCGNYYRARLLKVC